MAPNEKRIILKEDVLNWSNKNLTGETKEELKDSLNCIYVLLLQELSDKRHYFEQVIKKLNI